MEICQEAPAAQKSTKLKELMKDDLKKEAEDILEMLTRKESSARVLLKEQPCSQAPLAVWSSAVFDTACVRQQLRTHAHICPVGTLHIPISSVFASLFGAELKTKAAWAEKFQELEVAAEEKERMIENLLQALEKAEMKIRQKDSDLADF